MAGVEHPLLASLLQRSVARGQLFYMTVSSDSMAPLLEPGDEVAVAAVKAEELRPGDIVVLNEGPGFLTHRYWGTRKQKLITRGDRTLQFDPLWEPERLLGRIQARRRQGRTLSLQQGPGAWLVAHLARVAALEQRLCAGYAANPLPSAAGPTRLGRKMRENPRYPPGWLLRRALQWWRSAATFLVSLVSPSRRRERQEKGRARTGNGR